MIFWYGEDWDRRKGVRVSVCVCGGGGGIIVKEKKRDINRSRIFGFFVFAVCFFNLMK